MRRKRMMDIETLIVW